jgi:hypothetical protein
MTVSIGDQRSEAVWRILAVLYGMVVSFITSIVATIGIIWAVVDVVWQLLSNRNDLAEDSRPAMFVYNVLQWNLDLFVFALTGKGEFRWLP